MFAVRLVSSRLAKFHSAAGMLAELETLNLYYFCIVSLPTFSYICVHVTHSFITHEPSVVHLCVCLIEGGITHELRYFITSLLKL